MGDTSDISDTCRDSRQCGSTQDSEIPASLYVEPDAVGNQVSE